MKKVLKSVLVIGGIILATTVANAQQKIGHLNSQEIIQSHPEFKNAQQQMQTMSETKDKELQSMIQEYQKKETQANEKAMNRSEANKSAVDIEIQGIVGEMQQMQERIQNTRTVAQEELQKKYQELMNPIEQKVVTAINSIAKEQGFTYVLDLASGSVIYFESGQDLTPAVKTKLGI